MDKPCPVPHDRMKLLHVPYIDFGGTEHDDGAIVVFDIVVDHVISIFEELKSIKFPIGKIRPITEYNGSDDDSMEDNNTSAFNCRYIHGTTRFSIHAYGMAIDLNPLQNPIVYNDVTPLRFQPTGSDEYLDRSNLKPGMITPEVISIFKKHGFTTWGGSWSSLYDYHHFEVPRQMCEKLADLDYEAGLSIFERHVEGFDEAL